MPVATVADPGGVRGVQVYPPFGLHLTLRSTDDKLNGTPLSGYRSKKTAAMAHLRMLRRKFVRKQIDWTGSLSQKRSKWAWFCPKVGVASKILRALHAQDYITTPLLEILDPPLSYYPGWRSQRSPCSGL